jgi:ligand-binding sensor domain-containing protein
MRLSKKIILLLIVCLTVSFCIAQPLKIRNIESKYRVIHWDVEQGLSMGNCFAMLKDSIGFLWIATQVGLNRFDGNTFRIYLPDKNKNDAIAGSRINGLVEDSLHNIWVGTDRGLSRYDIQAEIFKNFHPEINTSGSNTFIIPFSATKNEVYCLEPEFKITAYNIHSYKKRIVTGNFHADVGNDFVRPSYSILDEETNNAWIIDGDGLLQVSLSTNKKVHYSLPSNKTSSHSPQIQGMCFDHLRHCIWLSTNEGLFQLELDSNKFFYCDVFKGVKNIKNFDTYPGISIDTKGKIWLCTNQQGIIIYDPANRTVVQPVFDNALRRSISDVNYSIYCDRNGVVWSGAFNHEGFYQLIPFLKVAFLS